VVERREKKAVCRKCELVYVKYIWTTHVIIDVGIRRYGRVESFFNLEMAWGSYQLRRVKSIGAPLSRGGFN